MRDVIIRLRSRSQRELVKVLFVDNEEWYSLTEDSVRDLVFFSESLSQILPMLALCLIILTTAENLPWLSSFTVPFLETAETIPIFSSERPVFILTLSPIAAEFYYLILTYYQ